MTEYARLYIELLVPYPVLALLSVVGSQLVDFPVSGVDVEGLRVLVRGSDDGAHKVHRPTRALVRARTSRRLTFIIYRAVVGGGGGG